VDLNKLIARVKGILLTPKTEWPVIAGEPATVGDLYKGYIIWLAAIPALFSFLSLSLIGMPFVGRIGFTSGLTYMVLGFALQLVLLYVLALIIDALAPTFAGQKNQTQAMKTVAYAFTASWIAGIGQIVPGLGFLISIAGAIYSVYLLYVGLPHTMKCPQEKAAGYTAVCVIIGIIANIVIGAVLGAVVGIGAYSTGSVFNSSSSSETEFDKDSTLGKLEQWSKNVEQAGKQFEAAQKSGDQKSQADAMQQMMGAALGSGGSVESLPPDRLKSFVPETLGGLARSNFSSERNNAMGMQISSARATYSNETGRSVNLEITDTGNAKGLLALAGWAGLETESESDSGYEKTYRENGRLIHERWDRNNLSGEFSVVLGDRFTVKVQGEATSIDELKAILAQVQLRELESLKNEGVKAQ
jgi:hypothetical protein